MTEQLPATDWIAKDLKYIWHPCSQMKDYESLPPILVERASGVYLREDGGVGTLQQVDLAV